MGEKGDGAKVKQMREMREAKFKAMQEAAKNKPAPPPPKLDDTEIGTLDNEPRDLTKKRTAKGSSHKSGRSGADSATTGSRSVPSAPEKGRSHKREETAGDVPSKTAGSVGSIQSRREAALAAMQPRTLGQDEGRCTGCGKVRALRDKRIVTHQKGLGKLCPGSRKPPEKEE